MRNFALELVLRLFGQDPIPDEVVPAVALAILECAPALAHASIEEMVIVHRELCIAILSRGAEKSMGVN